MPAYPVVHARVTGPVRFKAYTAAAMPLIERSFERVVFRPEWWWEIHLAQRLPQVDLNRPAER